MTADRLDEFFRAGPDLLLGADYQRAIELEDGRVLWTFQDGYLDDGDGEPTFVHNVGLLQDGRCSEALHLGDSTAPRSWIGSEDTIAYRHWFWPLDGYQLDDDTVVLFVAEMVERGDRYLANPEPIATWITEVDLATMTTGELRPAPDPGAALHGFDIVDDGHHRYLYAQCHRQFGFGILGHDECAGEVLVARQPIDDPSADLRYWDGVGWSDQPETARDIAPQPLPDDRGTVATPMQVAPHGDEWIAVTKLDDWWSTSIRLDRAPQPHGPWTTTAIVPVEGPGDPDEVATYFATFVPSVDRDRAIAVSANRWDGRPSPWYRPHVTALPIGAWDHNGAESRASDVVLTLAPG